MSAQEPVGDAVGEVAEADASAGATAEAFDEERAIAALFGDRAPLARAFADHLATTAVERGLLGPREVPRLWARHLLNCAAMSSLIPAGSTVVDVGSGAGLPGIAVAIARPDVRVTLLEPLQRRVSWLTEVVEAIDLGAVDVVRGRAEDGPRGRFDVGTARAVANLVTLAGWSLPLLRPGGLFLAIKGRSASQELDAGWPELRSLGVVDAGIQECGAAVLATPTTVVVLTMDSTPRVDAASRRAEREPREARRGRGRG